MPMPKQRNSVPSRMKRSMASRVYSNGAGWLAAPCGSASTRGRPMVRCSMMNSSVTDAAERNRRIGDADPQRTEIRRSSCSRSPRTAVAVDHHEDGHDRHQDLDDKIASRGARAAAAVSTTTRDVHVQAEPVAGRGAEEGQDDGEQHRGRLRPRRRAVEHVAREHRPRDDRRDQHQRPAGDRRRRSK